MAVLTWRNVDTPDYRGTLDAYRMFGDALTNATSAAQQGIKDFEVRRANNADRAFAEAAARYQNADDFRAALAADPSLGIQNVSAQALQNADKRVNTLLDQALTGTSIKRNNQLIGQQDILFGRQTDAYNRSENVRDAYAAALGDAVAGKEGAFATLMQNPAFRALSPDQQSKLVDDIAGGISGRTGRDQGRLGLETGRFQLDTQRWNQANAVRDDAAQTNGMRVAQDVLFKSSSADQARSILTSPEYASLDPRTRAVAMGVIGQTFGDVFAPNSGVSGSAGGGSIGPDGNRRVMGWTPRASYGGDNSDAAVNTKLSLVSKAAGGVGIDAPLSKEQFLSLDMTQGEGRAAAKNNLGNMRNTDGSWKTFESTDSYTNAQRAWLERRWNEGARSIRDAVEGRAVGPSSSASAARLIAARASQDDPDGATAGLDQARAARMNQKQAVDYLSNGPLKGMPVSRIQAFLDQTVQAARRNGSGGISYGEAASILENSSRYNQGGFFQAIRDGITGGGGNYGITIDENELDRRVRETTSGATDQRREQLANLETQNANLKILTDRRIAAQAELQRTLERASSQPGLAAQLPRLKDAYDRAVALEQAFSQSVANNRSSTPIREQPQENWSWGIGDWFRLRN